MTLLQTLAATVPFAFASGINLYATVAVLGLCSRFEFLPLPDQFDPFGHAAVIVTALVMFLVEFVADKVPWFDSLWDAVHTVIRPVGGALVAIVALGSSSPEMQIVVGLLGGSVALTTHLGKAGTRAVANTSPEPFSNWALSLIEDVFVVGLTWVAIEHPLIALTIVLALLAAIVAFASLLVRAIRNRFGRGRVSRV